MDVTPTLLLVEPLRRGPAHQAFNASLLLTCHCAFPTSRIVIAAFPDHLEYLQASLGMPNWLHYEVIDTSYSTQTDNVISAYRQAGLILSLASRWEAKSLIMTSVTTNLLW